MSVVLFGCLSEDEHPALRAWVASVVVEAIWFRMDHTKTRSMRGAASDFGDSVFARKRVGLHPAQL